MTYELHEGMLLREQPHSYNVDIIWKYIPSAGGSCRLQFVKSVKPLTERRYSMPKLSGDFTPGVEVDYVNALCVKHLLPYDSGEIEINT